MPVEVARLEVGNIHNENLRYDVQLWEMGKKFKKKVLVKKRFYAYHDHMLLPKMVWRQEVSEKYEIWLEFTIGDHSVEIAGFCYHSDFTWKVPKTASLTILAAMNVEFLENFDIFKCEIPKNQNSKPPNLWKWQFLTFWNQPNYIDFT